MGLAGLLLLAGCGLEAVDTRMRARGEVGVPEERALQVADVEFLCPHIVPINEREFSPNDIQRGEVDGAYGPYVPCGAVVPAGSGTCGKCNQPYRTPGERADGEDPPPVATWKMSCPVCHEAVDPTAVQVRGEDPALPNRFAPNQCWKCKTYYDAAPGDVLTAVAVHEEIVCPSCMKPIDPSLNACTTSSCKLGGVVRNVDDFEGPCWRCGGQGMCHECQGSGSGTLAVFGNTQKDCWSCDAVGRCPECEGSGFTTYVGGLPQKFATTKMVSGQATPLESKDRKWQHPADDVATDADADGAGE